jgi:hypothetical protein
MEHAVLSLLILACKIKKNMFVLLTILMKGKLEYIYVYSVCSGEI